MNDVRGASGAADPEARLGNGAFAALLWSIRGVENCGRPAVVCLPRVVWARVIAAAVVPEDEES